MDATSPGVAAPHGVSARPRAMAAALLAPALLITPPASAITASMPDFHRAFAAVPDADLWVRVILATPALFIVLSAPLAGYLADRFGAARLLGAAVVVYALAGSAPLLLDQLWAIFATRALLGIATGSLMVATTSLIGDLYDGAGRARLLGRQGALLVVGSILSTLAGGGLAELGWRAPHGVFLAALLLLPIFRLAFPAGTGRPARRTAATAALPCSILVVVAAIFLLNAVSGIAYFAGPSQAPFRLAALGVAEPSVIGLIFAASALASVASAASFRFLNARWNHFAIAALTFATIAAGYAGLALAPGVAWAVAGIVVAMVGLGLFAPNLQHWLLSVAPAAARGRLVGGLTMAAFLGMFLSPLITQPIAAAAGLPAAFLAVAAALALLALLLFALALRPR